MQAAGYRADAVLVVNCKTRESCVADPSGHNYARYLGIDPTGAALADLVAGRVVAADAEALAVEPPAAPQAAAEPQAEPAADLAAMFSPIWV